MPVLLLWWGLTDSPVRHLVEEVFHYAGAIYEDGFEGGMNFTRNLTNTWLMVPLPECPSTLYFHQRPLLASGEAPSPWGYWSLDPEPTPGIWPTLQLDGIELTCR